ncbi:WIAG-tail domain [Paenibacillus phoenicis]
MVPFLLKPHEEEATVKIKFESPFASSNYVVVAMTNHPAYYTSLKEQSPGSAVITISKLKDTSVNYGIVTWMAIGNTQ